MVIKVGVHSHEFSFKYFAENRRVANAEFFVNCNDSEWKSKLITELRSIRDSLDPNYIGTEEKQKEFQSRIQEVIERLETTEDMSGFYFSKNPIFVEEYVPSELLFLN